MKLSRIKDFPVACLVFFSSFTWPSRLPLTLRIGPLTADKNMVGIILKKILLCLVKLLDTLTSGHLKFTVIIIVMLIDKDSATTLTEMFCTCK